MDVTSVLPVLVTAVIAFIVFYLVALVVNQGVEVVKGVTRGIGKAAPGVSWFGLGGIGSYLAALLLAVAFVFYPDSGLVDLLSQVFSKMSIVVNPLLVQFLTAMAVWFLSMSQHDSGKMPSPLRTKTK